MLIKNVLMLGVMIVVFGESHAYRLDYHDTDVQDNGIDYLSKERHWVPTITGQSQIGKTIRQAIYVKEGEFAHTSYSVNLHIWYPIYHGEIFMYVRYRDNDVEWRKKKLLQRGFSHKDVFELDNLYCYAENEFPFSSVAKRYPVIFFCSGDLGTSAADYTVFCEELASHGYVVVSVENTHNNMMSVDEVHCAYEHLIKFNGDTADMFYEHVDFDRVGIIGHLQGGSIAYRILTEDPRFIAGVSLDGLPFDMDQKSTENMRPFTFIFSEEMIHEHNKIRQQNSTVRSQGSCCCHILYQDDVPVDIVIPQLKRQGFSDLVILKDLLPYKTNKHLFDLEAMTGNVDGRQTIKLINKYIVDFFAIHLK